MPIYNGPAKTIDGPNAGYDSGETIVQYSIPAGGTLLFGQVLCLNTQAFGVQNYVGLAAGSIPQPTGPSVGSGSGSAAPTTEIVVLPSTTGAGKVLGVFQGVYGTPPQGIVAQQGAIYPYALDSGATINLKNNNTVATVVTVNVQRFGFAWVLARVAAGGTAIKVADSLITSGGQVLSGSAASYVNVGQVLAMVNYTYVATTINAGSFFVTVANPAGMLTVGTSVQIDSALSGVQEIVPIAALASNGFTATFANAHNFAPVPIAFAAIASATLIAVPSAGSVNAVVPAYIDVGT